MYDGHYKGDVEPIELMESCITPYELMGILRGNIIKYASRIGKKDKVDKEKYKILKYAEWLHQVATGGKVNPHE